jgi:hypothetical protein
MPELDEVVEIPAPADVQQDDLAASEPAPEGEDKDKESGPLHGLQKKFDKLTTIRRNLERDNRELRDRVEAIERRVSVLPAKEQEHAEATDPKPDINTFTGTSEEFTEALSRWAARQEHEQLSKKQKKADDDAERLEQDREVVAQFQERVTEFAEAHDDYNDVVGSILLAETVGPSVQVAVMEDENAPAISYYLGQHPEICKKLNSMTPQGAVKYVGRLAERLFPETSEDDKSKDVDESSPPKPQPIAVPLKPLRKPSPTSSGLSDDLPPAEWARRFRKKMNYGG